MILNEQYIKQLVREGLKDFFDAQDSGDWHKYDNSLGRDPMDDYFEDETPVSDLVSEFDRIRMDELALYKWDLKEIYKHMTDITVRTYRYINTKTHNLDAVWTELDRKIRHIISTKSESQDERANFEALWNKLKQIVPQLA